MPPPPPRAYSFDFEKPVMRRKPILVAVLAAAAFWVTLAAVVFGQAPPPPPPPPPPLIPCTNPMGPEGCRMVGIPMIGIGQMPRWFTASELGGPVQEDAQCQGRLIAGAIRYFVNGTAPSAVVGTLVPPAPETREEDRDPTGTLEAGDVIVLWSRDLILGFKTVSANSALAELSWDCAL